MKWPDVQRRPTSFVEAAKAEAWFGFLFEGALVLALLASAALKAFVDDWIKHAREDGRFAKTYPPRFE